MVLFVKIKMFFVIVVFLWDVEFYIKVDDDVYVNFGKNKNKIIKMFYF